MRNQPTHLTFATIRFASILVVESLDWLRTVLKIGANTKQSQNIFYPVGIVVMTKGMVVVAVAVAVPHLRRSIRFRSTTTQQQFSQQQNNDAIADEQTNERNVRMTSRTDARTGRRHRSTTRATLASTTTSHAPVAPAAAAAMTTTTAIAMMTTIGWRSKPQPLAAAQQRRLLATTTMRMMMMMN
jgi:hypothetical protein